MRLLLILYDLLVSCAGEEWLQTADSEELLELMHEFVESVDVFATACTMGPLVAPGGAPSRFLQALMRGGLLGALLRLANRCLGQCARAGEAESERARRSALTATAKLLHALAPTVPEVSPRPG